MCRRHPGNYFVLQYSGNTADRPGLRAGISCIHDTDRRTKQKRFHGISCACRCHCIFTFNAIGSLFKYTADPQDKLPEITYWLMGSFTSATYHKILIGSPFILTGIVIIYLLRWRLNILALSEDEAKASGIDLKKTRRIFILASTIITASAVSMCGQVGWIGLLIPHCARMLVGSNNRYVVPVSISLGASFMILIDTLSRTLSVIELPLSVLTAIIGAPVFISLLNRSNLR